MLMVQDQTADYTCFTCHANIFLHAINSYNDHSFCIYLQRVAWRIALTFQRHSDGSLALYSLALYSYNNSSSNQSR